MTLGTLRKTHKLTYPQPKGMVISMNNASDIRKLKKLSLSLKTLTVFRALKEDPVISALMKCLDSCDHEPEIAVERYCDVAAALYLGGYGRENAVCGCYAGGNLSKYILSIVGDDENVYMRSFGNGGCANEIIDSVKNELKILQEVADLESDALINCFGMELKLPKWSNSKTNIAEYYDERIKNVSKYGYGIYARYRMFCLDGEGKIMPVKYPDTITLNELIDYKREQGIIIENTKALLCGRPAANMLLTGDAGTGKSSTVKAVVNELYGDGLRILEVRKDQLKYIPSILDELTNNPLKFIIFIDDLSFSNSDDNFGALKAVLEGSVSARSQNVVIYATSNRRHLVKENFSDRDGNDIHRNDTIQETVSLSERFGLHVTFQRPDKATYIDIVKHLADAHGIEYEPELIALAAEQFILMRGSSRSARAARQFIDSILAGNNTVELKKMSN